MVRLRARHSALERISAQFCAILLWREFHYRWREQLRSKGPDGFHDNVGRPAAEESAEVKRLKRELERVTEERDILEKAAAYFARELP